MASKSVDHRLVAISSFGPVLRCWLPTPAGDRRCLSSGEAFEKLEDEDEQGWCKGRKDGRVGLYPANYVQPV